VSVVIPAYNAVDTIGRALRSVYAQTYPQVLEVIVVDDGSTDGTGGLVKEAFPQVRYYYQENAGDAAAADRGARLAQGEYLAFLDADDEWLPHKLQRQIGLLQRHPGIGVLTCTHMRVVAGQRGPRFLPPVPPGADGGLRAVTFREWFFHTAFRWLHPCRSGWVMRRETYLAIGGFDPALRIVTSGEFLRRATGLGFSVVALCEPLYFYHVLPSSLSHSWAGKVRMLASAPATLARYDPRGQGWEADLLTEAEYVGKMQKVYLGNARRLARRGEREQAEDFLRRAAELARRGKGWLRLQHAILAAYTRLYLYLVAPVGTTYRQRSPG
jgi:glycosyltransferase involved in cell wall biosynthesis